MCNFLRAATSKRGSDQAQGREKKVRSIKSGKRNLCWGGQQEPPAKPRRRKKCKTEQKKPRKQEGKPGGPSSGTTEGRQGSKRKEEVGGGENHTNAKRKLMSMPGGATWNSAWDHGRSPLMKSYSAKEKNEGWA